MSVLFGMRKLYLFITFLMIFITLQAQNISVLPGDFYRDSKDLTARTQAVKNDNNKNCALLKIITTEKGFTFEPDALGICKEVEYKTSEIWVWLSPGSRRITIKHPQLGQLRDYMYPEAIEDSTVYVMKLTTAKDSAVVENVNTSNYLALSINPAEASVKTDGEMVPYGKLAVTTTPFGAEILLDGKNFGKTPRLIDNVQIGEYNLELKKEGYLTITKKVVIEENKTSEVYDSLQVYVPKKTTAISEQETENQNEKQTAKPAKTPVDYETSFFFTLNAAYAVNPQWSFGATVGAMKRWGGYLDLMVFESKNLVQKYKTMEEGKVYKLKDKSKTSRFSLMAGVVFRVCKPLSLHLGAGYGYRARLYSAKELGSTESPYEIYADPNTIYKGFNGEVGLMFHIKKCMISTGVTTINFKYMEFKLGLGLCL